MVARLSVDNVSEYLAISILYEDKFLQTHAMDLIKLKLADVRKTNGWIEFVNGNQDIMMKILSEL